MHQKQATGALWGLSRGPERRPPEGAPKKTPNGAPNEGRGPLVFTEVVGGKVDLVEIDSNDLISDAIGEISTR